MGPLTAEQLQQLIQQGQVNMDTLLWKEGMDGWTAAGDIPDAAGFFKSVPPPLPPEK